MATQDDVNAATFWLQESDRVLVVAGAGMSAGCAVDYTDPKQFAELYPGLVQYGFTTAYEAMMLVASQDPQRLMWGYLAHHILNMRFNGAPHGGYAALLKLIANRDYFVLTSNVDAMFARAGFDPARVYTPQGDYNLLQCALPCSTDVVEAKDICTRLCLPENFDAETYRIRDDVKLPQCQNCGGAMIPNVRASSSFTHAPHDARGDRFLEWIKAGIADTNSRLFVVEVGAGFNTPMVTRFPGEAIVRAHPRVTFVRINPQSGAVPRDLECAVSLPITVQEAFEQMLEAPKDQLKESAERVQAHRKALQEEPGHHPVEMWERYKKSYGHFDYEKFLKALRT